MKDKKILVFSFLIYWVCDILILIIITMLGHTVLKTISTIAQVLANINGTKTFDIGPMNWLIVIPVCIVIAIPFTFLVMKVILPLFMRRYYKQAQGIMNEVKTNGNSTQTMLSARKLMNDLESKKNVLSGVYNYCAMLIAADCSDRMDYEEAFSYLDRVILTEYDQRKLFVSIRRNYVNYLVFKMRIECYAGNEERATQTYEELAPYISEFKGEAGFYLQIECSIAAYETLCHKGEDAILRLTALENSSVEQMISVDEGLCYAYRELGQKDKALEKYHELFELVTGDYTKRIIRYQMEELKIVSDTE